MTYDRRVGAGWDPEEFEQRLGALAALLDERAVLGWSAAAVATAGGLDVAWVGKADEHGALRIQHVHGGRTDLLLGLAVPSGWGVTGKAFASIMPQAVEDYFAATSITHHFDRHIQAEGVRRLVAAPVLVDGRIVAVIAGGSRSDGSVGSIGVARVEQAAARTSTALRAAARSRQLAQAAVQEDRRELAAALHDDVGALIFAIQAGVRDLAGSLADNSALRAKAESIEVHALEAAQALRDSLTMMHAAPSQVALEAEIRSDAKAFEQRSGISTSVIVLNAGALNLEGAPADALAGAVREALLNVEKHAAATSVVITVGRCGRGVTLSVIDDGRGPTPESDGGLGLTELRRRFARLGGTVDLTSPEDGGAVLRVRLPA